MQIASSEPLGSHYKWCVLEGNTIFLSLLINNISELRFVSTAMWVTNFICAQCVYWHSPFFSFGLPLSRWISLAPLGSQWNDKLVSGRSSPLHNPLWKAIWSQKLCSSSINSEGIIDTEALYCQDLPKLVVCSLLISCWTGTCHGGFQIQHDWD
jgi:hypothetical protein